MKVEGGNKKNSRLSNRLFLAVWTGLEPATPCVTGRYSNQLNYHTVFLIANAKVVQKTISANFFRLF